MTIIMLFDPAKNVINPLQYEAILKIFVEEAYCYYIRLSTFSKIKKRFWDINKNIAVTAQ